MTEQIAGVDYTDPHHIMNPYPALNALRESARIAKDVAGIGWVVTRYEDVDAVLHDRALSSDPANGGPGTAAAMLHETLGADDRAILFMDDPDHARLRKLVSKAFTPRAIEAIEPRTREIAHGLLDDMADRETFDFMHAFAQPLPTIVIAEMIGVEAANHQSFKEWSDAALHSLDPFASPSDQERAIAARASIRAYFEQVIAARMAERHDDLVSRLVDAREGSDSLSAQEMVAVLRLLLSAGNVTTTDLIGNGLFALMNHPEQDRLLRDQPTLIANAVEEMLRYDSPVINTVRTPLRDAEVAGCPVAAGESVIAELAAANHDPRRFADPDRFDIRRVDLDHLAFGAGIHHCLGSALARMEARVAFEALLERTASIEVDSNAEPQYRTILGFRGFKSLPVKVKWR